MSYPLSMLTRGHPRGQTAVTCTSGQLSCAPTWNTFHLTGHINTHKSLSEILQCCPLSLSIHLLLSTTLSPLSMSPATTRQKNKTSHPGAPDMTPSQLASAGIARLKKSSSKGPSKDQQITALKEELHAAQEAMSTVSCFFFIPFSSRSNVCYVLEPHQPTCGARRQCPSCIVCPW